MGIVSERAQHVAKKKKDKISPTSVGVVRANMMTSMRKKILWAAVEVAQFLYRMHR